MTPPKGQPPTLHGRLLPICSILKEYLEQIKHLVDAADGLSRQYGLLPTQDPPTKSAAIHRLVDRMQQSIQLSRIKRAMGNYNEVLKDNRESEVQTPPAEAISGLNNGICRGVSNTVSAWGRVRWAVRDLDKFDSLVKILAHHIRKLNNLLSEAEQPKSLEDSYRVNMVVVGSAPAYSRCGSRSTRHFPSMHSHRTQDLNV